MRRLTPLVFILMGLCGGCDRLGKTSVGVNYTPPFLPIQFHVDREGNVTVSGARSIVTPIGRFELTADVPLSSNPDVIHVIVRNRQKGINQIYDIGSNNPFKTYYKGEGSVTTTLEPREVIIELVSGTVQVESANSVPAAATASPVPPEHAAPGHTAPGVTAPGVTAPGPLQATIPADAVTLEKKDDTWKAVMPIAIPREYSQNAAVHTPVRPIER